MPHNQQAEGGAGTVLCPHISSTNIKKSREKGKEISSSSSTTLTLSSSPFLKRLLPKPHHLCSTDLAFSFDLEQSLTLHLYFPATCHTQARLYHRNGNGRAHVQKTSGEGNGLLLPQAQPGSHRAELLHACGGNHCISTASAILSLAAHKIPLRKKRWGGERRNQKNYCVPRGKK